METENIKPKVKMPMIPLRDVVIFPNTVSTLFVGREKSIKALQESMKLDKSIILVTQKNSEIDDPKKTDIFMYGCEGNILQLLKLPDGTVKVLVEGIKRVKILDFKDNEKFTKSKNWKWLELSREAKWKSLDKAMDSNLNIALGTDAGFMLPHGSMNYREMEYMIQGGMSNMQAIKAATQIGGKLLGLNVGTIEIGQKADILVIKGNPLKDIKILSDNENIEVFKDGKQFNKYSILQK